MFGAMDSLLANSFLHKLRSHGRYFLCCMQRSYSGTGGLIYLFPQPAHLEMLPEMKCRLKGAFFCAIGGACITGEDRGLGDMYSSY